MYNLIIALMSISLIGLTSLVALSYGGVIFSQKGGQGVARSQAVTLLTNAQQVAGAQRLYAIENAGNRATSYEVLVSGGYLQAVPELPVGAVTGPWEMSGDGFVSMIPLNTEKEGQTGSAAERICELLPDFGGSGLITAGSGSPVHADLQGAGVWFGCVTNISASSVADATEVWFAHVN